MDRLVRTAGIEPARGLPPSGGHAGAAVSFYIANAMLVLALDRETTLAIEACYDAILEPVR